MHALESGNLGRRRVETPEGFGGRRRCGLKDQKCLLGLAPYPVVNFNLS